MTQHETATQAYDALAMALSKAKAIVRVTSDAALAEDEESIADALEGALTFLEEVHASALQLLELKREKTGGTP